MTADDRTDRRVPSIDQLVALFQALWGFDDMRGKGNGDPPSMYWRDQRAPIFTPDGPSLIVTQEDKMLPRFTRLADALRDIRPLIDKKKVEGWEFGIGPSLRVVRDFFDATTKLWGWEHLAKPSPDRDAHEKTCREQFRKDVEAPLLIAAMTIRDACQDVECYVDYYADEGRRRGYRATMTLEEANARFPETLSRLIQGQRFGKCAPVLQSYNPDEEDSEFSKAFKAIRHALMPLAPDRVREYDQGVNRSEVAETAPKVGPPSRKSKLATLTPENMGKDARKTIIEWFKRQPEGDRYGIIDIANGAGYTRRYTLKILPGLVKSGLLETDGKRPRLWWRSDKPKTEEYTGAH